MTHRTNPTQLRYRFDLLDPADLEIEHPGRNKFIGIDFRKVRSASQIVLYIIT
jgi:hypothetical protein